MLSMQLQACPPARFSRLSPAAFFEDSTATFETRNLYFSRDFPDATRAQRVCLW
jgi:hypothetical protein